jgi:nucleoside-diphosphate-sugar epimerase
MVNIFGKGFIGTCYANMYPSIINDKNDLIPKSNNILYFISTTDNYNVHTNPYIDIETNLTTLIRVLENTKTLDDVVFNFASSWFVYGNVEPNASETSHCDPKGFYSITKRTAEQLLISYCETYKINYRVLRFSNVLGPGDKHVSAKKNALTFLLRKLKNHEEINLYNDGDFYRDYMHVADVCSAINLVLEKGNYNEIYNIGTGIPVLFKDAIDYIVKKTNSKSKVNHIDQSSFHKIVQTPSFYMNCEKLKKLGYANFKDIYTMLDELIEEKYN